MSLDENLGEVSISNRDSYLRDKDLLLRRYSGEYVAYGKGKFLDHSKSFDDLTRVLRDMNLQSDVYIALVDEESFEEPKTEDMPSILEVDE